MSPQIKEDDMDAIKPEERRRLTRHPGNSTQPVRLRFDGNEIVAKVQNISVRGIGFLTNQRLEPGSWLMLEPAKLTRGPFPELRAEIKHTTELENGHLVGCDFARLLTVQDMMALG
jgi:PilZ domain